MFLFAGFILLLITVLVVGRWWIGRAFPQVSGTLQLVGLDGMVEIRRDQWGVPHIYATSVHDLFFAQGVVHAQDRLWQMDLQRRVGLGRLSEFFGEACLSRDRFLRTIGIAVAAQREWEGLSEEGRAVLEAYAEGVNAYMSTEPVLPLEYQLLGVVWEPWEPLDTLAAIKMLEWELEGDWEEVLLRMLLIELVGESRAALLLGDGGGEGGNGWAIMGKHTATGRPILASDIHLGIRMPSLWYEIGLHGPEFEVVGASMPGVPAVLMGHNADLAWGMTNLVSQTQQLFIERLNESQDAYEWQAKMVPLAVRREMIRVKDGEDVLLEVKETRHGALLNDVVDGLERPMAWQWKAMAAPTHLVEALIGINQARSRDQMLQARRQSDSSALAFIYADGEGNIGLIGRADEPEIWNPPEGYLVYGSAFEGQEERLRAMIEQEGAITPDDVEIMLADVTSLPAQKLVPLLTELASDDIIVQRAQEQLGAWNYQMRAELPGATIYAVTRQYLLRELLADEFGHDEEGVQLLDTYLSYHQANVRLMMRLLDEPTHPLWDDGETVLEEKRDDILLRALALATDWLGRRYGDVPHEWSWNRLHIATFEHALGTIKPLDRIFNRIINVDGYSDTINASYPPSISHLGWTRRALTPSPSPNGPLFGQKGGGRGGLFPNKNRRFLLGFERPHPGPLPTLGEGRGEGVRAEIHTKWEILYPPLMPDRKSYTAAYISSYRQLIDVGAYDNSRMLHTTGQSGQPFHPHYDDMIEAWRDVKLLPMLWSDEQTIGASEGRVLKLVP